MLKFLAQSSVILLVLFVAFTGAAQKSTGPDPRFAQWASAKTPTKQTTQVIGGYAKGCINGAAELPLQGDNYLVVNLTDKRNYGHPDMIRYLQELSFAARVAGVPPLLIEDLSGPRGGPVIKGHASHQNGLDVDISFTLATPNMTEADRAHRPEVSFVEERKTLKPTWTAHQTHLLALAIAHDRVDRIFVAPAIKKFMCNKFPDAPWQYKLRAWWGHEDHLHVRLKCPVGEAQCVSQSIDKTDVQCGAGVEKWLRSVALPAKPKATEPEEETPEVAPATPEVVKPVASIRYKKFPILPPQCQAVVSEK